MRMLLLFIFAFINSSESDQQLYGECKLRTTVDCGEGSNGPDTNSGRSNLLAGAGLPGKRGQKGASGEKGSIGAKGDVGQKGLKGDSGTNCNTTEFEIIHKENQQLKNELRIITNYTRKLETNLNTLKSDHEFLKNFTYSHMVGRPCLVDAPILNGKFDKPIGSIVKSGSNLTIKCNEGYVVKSVEKVTCQDGKLSLGENIGCKKPRDCDEIKNSDSSVQNGVYTIYPGDDGSTQVFCDMQSEDHAWTVINNRYDGSVDYDRSWSEYVAGFGNKQTEYWLGLTNIYNLMKEENYKLKFSFERFNGNTAYALYDVFYIGNEEEGFKLTFDGYSGTAGDSLSSLTVQGMKFSTKEVDNDIHPHANCAVQAGGSGGWWYSNCQFGAVNGEYQKPGNYRQWNGLNWYNWIGLHESLKAVQMKIQKKQ